MANRHQNTSNRHQEGQGPASLHQPGPAAGHSLEELGQPTRSQNAEEVMEAHFNHPKNHTPGSAPK